VKSEFTIHCLTPVFPPNASGANPVQTGMLHDLRFVIRQLRRTPVFAVVAILTFALGMGTNAAVFSVMNAVVLRYLPVDAPDRLVILHTSKQPDQSSQTGFDNTSLSLGVYEQLRAERSIFSDLMAYVPLGTSQTAVRVGNEPETVWADMVTGNFFSGLGVRLQRGRGFTPADEAEHAQMAVISHGYWTRRFAQRADAIGSTIFVKGIPFTIVGITPAQFAGVGRGTATDVWIPIQKRAELKPWGRPAEASDSFHTSPNWWFLMAIGRLAPGVTADQALASAQPVFARAAYAPTGGPRQGETPARLFFSSVRGVQGLRDQYRQPLTVLMAMVGLVLLIACGNVATLVAARNADRVREFSLRAALGGSTGRLLRQLLTESLVLVAAGTAVGWLVAAWATRALAVWSELDVVLAPDRTVFAYTLALSAVAAVVFSLASLRTARRTPLGVVLRSSALNSTADRTRMRGARIIVAAQIALCVALLVGAGLLVRTLRNLNGADLGLRTSGLLVFGITPPSSVQSEQAAVQFYQSLLARIRALPGVEGVTLMGNRIGSGWSNNTTAVVDGARPSDSPSPMRWNNVGTEYFRVLGTPLLLGRDFSESDLLAGAPVVIVNDAFARRYLPNREPLGHRVALSTAPEARQYTIIGVAANSRYTSVRESERAMAYFLYSQVPGISGMHVELRAAGDPTRLLPDIRRIVSDLGPDLPLLRPMTQQAQFARSFSNERLFSRLATAFGLLAAALVAAGLYGTLSYRVSRRTAEIGVRMALGARRSQVLWMVLRDSLAVCAIGIVVGLPLAIAGSRFLESILFGLTKYDPMSFAAALIAVSIVSVGASLIPAGRAVSVDPMRALRAE
jgi:predicted permease